MEDVTGATAMSLVPTGGGDVVQQLDAAAARFAWWWPVAIAGFVLGALSMPAGLIIWVASIPLCVWLFLRDHAAKQVVLFYDVNDAQAVWFDFLVTQWTWLTDSQKLWRVVQSGRVVTAYQFKTNAGASSLINRVSAGANTMGPKHLSTNIAVPSLNAGNSSLYFLPDRVLQRDGKHYSDISYQHLHASGSRKRFIEGAGPVATDAESVGETWTYINVEGGPDRRYANNPMQPVMLYGELQLTSPEGLNWHVQTSRADAAAAIASVLSTVPELGRQSEFDQPTGSQATPTNSMEQTIPSEIPHIVAPSDSWPVPPVSGFSTVRRGTLAAFGRAFANGLRSGFQRRP
jgi:hypothetical protein